MNMASIKDELYGWMVRLFDHGQPVLTAFQSHVWDYQHRLQAYSHVPFSDRVTGPPKIFSHSCKLGPDGALVRTAKNGDDIAPEFCRGIHRSR
jgi:hypothetical protein